jgi:hypothetical protein
MSSKVGDSYLVAHRYDGAAVEHDERNTIVPCAIQERDIGVVRDVWKHKFLSAPQLFELWWPNRSAWAGQRRLLKLFHAGLLERFRPVALLGTFPWTYHLGERGHRLLQRFGDVAPGTRYRRRPVYDFGHVLHELQLNAWVLACRRVLGSSLLAWDGESDVDPPRGEHTHAPGYDVGGLREPEPRLVRPDAVLEIATGESGKPRTFLVEFDRTQRIDKNYGKFRRYDAFLNSWWPSTAFGSSAHPPYVLFVCADEGVREQFLTVADQELTGRLSRPGAPPDEDEYVGRRRVLFVTERDAHDGSLDALRLPARPPGHPSRAARVARLAFAQT